MAHQNFQLEKCRQINVMVDRSHAVHLYWLLEAYESLWSFSTQSVDRSKLVPKERIVEVKITESQFNEAKIALEEIVKEVPTAAFLSA